MTKIEALERMEEQHGKFTAAIRMLPDEANIINCSQNTGHGAESYIQLSGGAELPSGIISESEADDEYNELSVSIGGVKVLWLAKKEAIQ